MKNIFVLGIVLVILLPILVLAINQGKAKGNSCMSQCMGVEADNYDLRNELAQFCKSACNVGTGQGSCSTSEDGCCVMYTDDLDCVVEPTCTSEADGCCLEGSEDIDPDCVVACSLVIESDDPYYGRFEQPTRDNACITNSDCFVGGCYAETCTADGSVYTLCNDLSGVTLPSSEGFGCGCVDNTCVWNRDSCTE